MGGGREGPQCCLPGLLAASGLVPGGLLSQTETTGRCLAGTGPWGLTTTRQVGSVLIPVLQEGDTEPQGFRICSSCPSC